MIISYRGHGFWAFIILGCSLGVGLALKQDLFGTGGSLGGNWIGIGVGLVIGGMIVWQWGKRANGPLDRHEEERPWEYTGHRHSLYGFRMENCGLFGIGLGVLFIVAGLGKLIWDSL